MSELQSDPDERAHVSENLNGEVTRFDLPLPTNGGKPITAYHFQNGPSQKKLLLIAGVHGDEPEGIFLVRQYLEKIHTYGCPEGLDLVVVPEFNPDGSGAGQRKNGNGVDLNRNMPTVDWTKETGKDKYFPGSTAASEPETKNMLALIEAYNPDVIISCHSYNPCLNYNGPSLELAEAMSAANKYKPVADIGYPTPGSLGTWAGHERKIPTITFEVERDVEEDMNWRMNEGALDNAVEWLLKQP